MQAHEPPGLVTRWSRPERNLPFLRRHRPSPSCLRKASPVETANASAVCSLDPPLAELWDGVDCQLTEELTATIDPASHPLELQGVLEDLACRDPDAAPAADQIPSRDYPLPSRLEAEPALLHSPTEQHNNDRRQELEARIISTRSA
jgi:hypothetical protein